MGNKMNTQSLRARLELGHARLPIACYLCSHGSRVVVTIAARSDDVRTYVGSIRRW